ncbi:NAD(P)/FAD-dependent oxidoreductase [Thermococcus argininiproducens]|uniref:NAD(P)/FAD-dependent oxidoreductase n=1 Tax=Thermococcus argininiproducens TaxID=2866384 RepID=A0A9E7MC76_9EURY|nr:NAD(P)/FAD-dependent oxidoreductase [Thermococcus argininiproducens]USH00740.1 NAD(P)/FAD-dependent oxidoreductase [Thermococcus argininiproducens]
MRKFDVVVIGTGVAGSSAVYKFAKAGLSVAIVDERPFGGTCALRGCDPKKILIGGAELVDWIKRMNDKGIEGKVHINWKKLMAFKREWTKDFPEKMENALKKAGIETIHGRAQFIDKDRIQVNGDVIISDKFLIATGAKPRELNIPGEEYVITSDEFLELDELPERIVFIGGGYISFEFAHLAARAGTSVIILHRSERPLKNFEPYIVDILLKATEDAGINVITNAPVKEVKKKEEVFVVKTPQGDFEADLVVHGAGRVPNINNLGLDEAGVEYDKRGIKVNEYMQTTNETIYAAGDCAKGGLPLTPVAAVEGSIAASNIIEGNHVKINYTAIPTVVFTIPPMASVGLKEEEARKKGLKFVIKKGDTSKWYNSIRINQKYSCYEILIGEGNRILGAHLLGQNAEEIMNIFALAIKLGLTAKDLKHAYYTYPSHSYDILYML